MHYSPVAYVDADPSTNSPLKSSANAFPALIGSDLELVAADIHTAPSARAFFAGVKKVKNARLTSANAVELRFTKQIRGPI